MWTRNGLYAALALMAGCDGSLDGQASLPDAGATARDGAPEAADPASLLSAGMEAVDFGCVGLDKPVAYRVLIENTSAGAVGPLDVSLAPSSKMLLVLADGCSGLTLQAAEACVVSIFFMAATALEAAATLEVTAPNSAPLRLPVRAQSSPLGDRMEGVEPLPFDFGTIEVGSASAALGLQLRNIGDETTTVPAATLLKGEAFQITADDCSGRAVPPLAGCGVTVRFAPKAAGKHIDQLRLGPGKACDPFPPILVSGTGR
jgi:hypothetical protein